MHISWWPTVVKRVEGSDAPEKAKIAAASKRHCRVRRAVELEFNFMISMKREPRRLKPRFWWNLHPESSKSRAKTLRQAPSALAKCRCQDGGQSMAAVPTKNLSLPWRLEPQLPSCGGPAPLLVPERSLPERAPFPRS